MDSQPEVSSAAPVTPPAYLPGTLFERALDLVFPPTCVQCHKIGRWICERCWFDVAWRGTARCARCGATSLEPFCARCQGFDSALDGLDAVTIFEGVSREAVHAMKFEGQHAITALMGPLMATRAPAGVTLVVPVPLHAARRRERGFDQCVMLAEQTAKRLDLPTEPSALKRVRRTQQQALLKDPEVRRQNVMGAFEARANVEGDVILLIDDVTTSGATLEAAAGPLKLRGAAEVHGLVFASARTRSPEN